MKVINDLKRAKVRIKNTAVTIGVFDAVHLGHQELIQRLKRSAKARKLKAFLVTFDPYPRETLDGCSPTTRLNTKEEKLSLFAQAGIQGVAFLKFTRAFSRMKAVSFIKKLLVDKLGMKYLVVGADFTFGRKAAGDRKMLENLSGKMGFDFRVEKILRIGNKPVKSSLIRDFVTSGRMRRVRDLTGRYYRLRGRVVKGAGRGRKLGFNTANIEIPKKLLPASGIYASYSRFGRKMYKSVTYVGTKPTFEGSKLFIETYVFGLQKNLYGRIQTIYFVEKLREDKKFKNASSLVNQIAKDVSRAKAILK